MNKIVIDVPNEEYRNPTYISGRCVVADLVKDAPGTWRLRTGRGRLRAGRAWRLCAGLILGGAGPVDGSF